MATKRLADSYRKLMESYEACRREEEEDKPPFNFEEAQLQEKRNEWRMGQMSADPGDPLMYVDR